MSDFWKDKKVIVYIALPHHTRFLTPVMEDITKKRAQVTYVVGQAERSQEITAVTLGLEYAHVFDYVSTKKDHEDVKIHYENLVSTFSRSLKDSFLFGTSPITVLDKTLFSTAMEYVGFRNLIQREKPDICFALHELNRWGKMLGFWAKKYNVPFVTFQEGMYYGMDFGYMGHVQYSSLDMVWGDRLKKKLTGFDAPGDKIIPTGNTHLAKELFDQKTNRVRDKKRKSFKYKKKDLVFLLLISGTLPVPERLFPILEKFSSTSSQHLIIKFHPRTLQSQIKAWKKAVPNNLQKKIKILHEQENVYDLLSACDVCLLVQPSTTGIEALAFGKPLVYLTGTLDIDDSDFFSQRGAAVSMTPFEFAEKIEQATDFNSLISSSSVMKCLADELANTETAVDLAKDLSKKLILANQTKPLPKIHLEASKNKHWSFIIPLSEDCPGLLEQLEILSQNSKNQGDYQVILIEPENISKDSKKILDSLHGDLLRISVKPSMGFADSMNFAAQHCTGENLIFLNQGLIPFPQWLNNFKQGFLKYGQNHIFGGRVLDNHASLIHGGMVVDQNNSPVSAYWHLESEFPSAMKERFFQMLDYAICVNRSFFSDLGGFAYQAGKFAFMDLCLRANEKKHKKSCIYLPNVCFMAKLPFHDSFDPDACAYFYGRWHGSLWESQTDLYKQDKISLEQIDTARMSKAASSTILGC